MKFGARGRLRSLIFLLPLRRRPDARRRLERSVERRPYASVEFVD